MKALKGMVNRHGEKSKLSKRKFYDISSGVGTGSGL